MLKLVNVQQERLNEEEKQQIIYGKTRKLTQFHSVFDVKLGSALQLSLLSFNLDLFLLYFNKFHRLCTRRIISRKAIASDLPV